MQKPFEAGRAEGRDRLMVLLRQVMIRAAKSAIRTIPPCTRQVLVASGHYTQSYRESLYFCDCRRMKSSRMSCSTECNAKHSLHVQNASEKGFSIRLDLAKSQSCGWTLWLS